MLRILFIMISCVLFLSACSSSAAPITEPETPGDTRVRIRFSAVERYHPDLKPLIEQFNEANRDMRVQLVATNEEVDWDDVMQTIVDTADTAVATFYNDRKYTRDYLHDLRPLMEADTTFKRDIYYPNFDKCMVADTILCLPLPAGGNAAGEYLAWDSKDHLLIMTKSATQPEYAWRWLAFLSEQSLNTDHSGTAVP